MAPVTAMKMLPPTLRTKLMMPETWLLASFSVMHNLAHGLAVTQKILGAELSQKSTRSLIQSLFDHLMSSE
jgi:BarA-like signal transduction histidine kinase